MLVMLLRIDIPISHSYLVCFMLLLFFFFFSQSLYAGWIKVLTFYPLNLGFFPWNFDDQPHTHQPIIFFLTHISLLLCLHNKLRVPKFNQTCKNIIWWQITPPSPNPTFWECVIILIIVVISITLYFIDKGEHTMLYKINRMYVHKTSKVTYL